MKKYFVTGGTYTNERFEQIDSSTEVLFGPFEDYHRAFTEWKSLSMQNVDNALCRYLIITEDTPEEFWVIGGVYTDTNFSKLQNDAVEKGPFTDWAKAESTWRSLSMEYMDNALARFEIQRR